MIVLFKMLILALGPLAAAKHSFKTPIGLALNMSTLWLYFGYLMLSLVNQKTSLDFSVYLVCLLVWIGLMIFRMSYIQCR